MTPYLALPETLEALPNPRGGAVRSAELALNDAQRSFETLGDTTAPLMRAAHALRDAGWLNAQRFAETLLLASPFVAQVDRMDMRRNGLAPAQLFRAALGDFAHALSRRNLRELSCSPSLFARYRALHELVAERAPGLTVSFDEFALAGRPMPPVTLRVQPPERLVPLRTRYESALLPVLKAHSPQFAATHDPRPEIATLDACIAELAAAGADHPYDFWRLAKAACDALRASGRATTDDVRRLYARCNLVLADHARGIDRAPRSLVRALVAMLWRDYALFGAAAEDSAHVDLLRDYGLTVDWHVAGTQLSEIAWEHGAREAQRFVEDRATLTRDVGLLTVAANDYDDFLQNADAAIIALGDHARGAYQPDRVDPDEALRASDAAYRVGASAGSLGLGHVALLADALGLAWRRVSHAHNVNRGAAGEAREGSVVPPPDSRVLEQATEALRAMLHKMAAGIASSSEPLALATLCRTIEHGGL